MSVPDHRHIVEHVFLTGGNGHGHTLTTKEGAGRFVEAAAAALHAVDPNWGHLRKPAGRTHVVDAQGNRHAVDVVLYRGARYAIVDIIVDAGEPGARLGWGVEEDTDYTAEDWYAPVGVAQPGPVPVPPVDDLPAPPPDAIEQALLALLTEIRRVEGKVDRLLEIPSPAPSVAFPDYRAEGTIRAGFLGNLPFSVTMKPVPS